jgi:hypothetical protein
MALSYGNVLDNSWYPRLPQELFRPIFEHLNGHRPTLFALSLCTRSLREDAERELYTRLDASSAANAALHTAFLTTVSQNRRLASYVRMYHINSIVHYQEVPLWHLLYQALRCMTGLKALRLRVSGGHPAAELLLDAPFQLESLHWGNHSEGGRPRAAAAPPVPLPRVPRRYDLSAHLRPESQSAVRKQSDIGGLAAR